MCAITSLRTASATSQMKSSCCGCRSGNKASSGFGVSDTMVSDIGRLNHLCQRDSGFQTRRFGVSHTLYRGITHRLCLYTPSNGHCYSQLAHCRNRLTQNLTLFNTQPRRENLWISLSARTSRKPRSGVRPSAGVGPDARLRSRFFIFPLPFHHLPPYSEHVYARMEIRTCGFT